MTGTGANLQFPNELPSPTLTAPISKSTPASHCTNTRIKYINSVDSTQIEGKMFEFKDFGTIQRKLESISTKVSAMIPPGPYIPFLGFYQIQQKHYHTVGCPQQK